MNECRIFLVNGFLGSGKTTLIKRLLTELVDYKIGLLENEYGEVGIDGTFFSQDELNLVEIDNGSIFCSCRSDQFLEGLQELLKHDLDILFIESSGLSDPSPMERDLDVLTNLIGNVFIYEGNLCVIDSINFQDTLEVLESVRRQIEYSNLVLLNKVDLINSAELADLREIIHAINPRVNIVETQYCKLPFQQILSEIHSDVLPKPTDSFNRPSNGPRKVLLQTPSTTILKKDAFLDFLNHFASQTFRLKGFIQLFVGVKEKADWYYVDGVQNAPDISKTKLIPKKTEIVVILDQHNPLGEIIQEAWHDLISHANLGDITQIKDPTLI
ncbi:MAG: CobW family GTP-binding protein [Promethearchaeota archaeon]